MREPCPNGPENPWKPLPRPDPWNVLRVHCGREIWIAGYLAQRGIENYLPVYRRKRQLSHRAPESVESPLFPGYLLVRHGLSLLHAPGIYDVLRCAGRPSLLSHAEVQQIRELSRMTNASPCRSFEPGAKVEIKCGPLRGVSGVFIREKEGGKGKLIVLVEMFKQAISVECTVADLV